MWRNSSKTGKISLITKTLKVYYCFSLTEFLPCFFKLNLFPSRGAFGQNIYLWRHVWQDTAVEIWWHHCVNSVLISRSVKEPMFEMFIWNLQDWLLILLLTVSQNSVTCLFPLVNLALAWELINNWWKIKIRHLSYCRSILCSIYAC